MRKRNQIILALLLAAVLLATFWIAGRSWAKPETQAVVVAKTDLMPGHVVAAADIALVNLPMDCPVGHCYTQVRQVIGETVSKPMRTDEIIQSHRMGRAAGLTYPSGGKDRRLLTVELSPAQANGGWLAAGNRADLYLLPGKNQSQAPICVEQVQIAAVLSPHRQSGSEKEASVMSNITVCLDLSRMEADRVVSLLPTCQVYLSMVNGSDTESTADVLSTN